MNMKEVMNFTKTLQTSGLNENCRYVRLASDSGIQFESFVHRGFGHRPYIE